jgi:selenocysteine lyase/cysteine desulfurase
LALPRRRISSSLLAYSYGRHFLKDGDEIVITELEHHANFVPWLELSKERDLALRFIPITSEGRLDLNKLGELITSRTKLVSFAHVSNVMPPFLTGGDMISAVGFEGARWNDVPLKFEAGTPAFVEAIGLGAAVDYLSALGMAKVRAHEKEITAYALERLAEVPGARAVWRRLRSTASIRTIWRHCSTAKAWRFARVTTARSRCTSGLA